MMSAIYMSAIRARHWPEQRADAQHGMIRGHHHTARFARSEKAVPLGTAFSGKRKN